MSINAFSSFSNSREACSKVLSVAHGGAAVSLSRNDVDYLVTEYGCVALRGTSLAERAKRIISVAHPNFREQIKNEALALGIIAE